VSEVPDVPLDPGRIKRLRRQRDEEYVTPAERSKRARQFDVPGGKRPLSPTADIRGSKRTTTPIYWSSRLTVDRAKAVVRPHSPPPQHPDVRSPRRSTFPTLDRPSPAALLAIQRTEGIAHGTRTVTERPVPRPVTPRKVSPPPKAKPENPKDLFATHWDKIDPATLKTTFKDPKNRARSLSVQRKIKTKGRIPGGLRPGDSQRTRKAFLKNVRSVSQLAQYKRDLTSAYTTDLENSDRQHNLNDKLRPVFMDINNAISRLKREQDLSRSGSKITGLKPTKPPRKSRAQKMSLGDLRAKSPSPGRLSKSKEREYAKHKEYSDRQRKEQAKAERESWVTGRSTPARPKRKVATETGMGFAKWQEYANKY